MNYDEALAFLNSFIDYERIEKYSYEGSFKLDRTRRLLELLGDPQNYLRCIHVAGTKGKGSVCAMTASILRAAGFKVGLYTSPHLYDFRERIRVLEIASPCPTYAVGQVPPRRWDKVRNDKWGGDFEGMISKEEICELAEHIKPHAETVNSEYKDEPLTFFEVYTALAFLYFSRQLVDYAILEVGLGGRLDATNTIEAPLACCITPISLEHTDKLGATITEIACEKAAIIKKGADVVSAPQEPEALAQIQNACVRNNAELVVAGLMDTGLQGIELGLLGRHQIENASCAVEIVKCLPDRISEDAVREGLRDVRWPGRLEVVSEKPRVVLDGAQNARSAGVLAQEIRELFKFEKLILVAGLCKDKDIEGFLHQFLDLADEIILTKSENPRAADPEAIGQVIGNEILQPFGLQDDQSGKIAKNSPTGHLTDSVSEAMDLAHSRVSEDDLILVSGSLFVVAEARWKTQLQQSQLRREKAA